MRKLKEKLNNKKGFTLVELIVVIVIILILAAVLIPNVMRYINEARKSAVQSEASSYLTELQGYEAEYYAKYDADLSTTNWSSAGYTLTKSITPKFADSESAAAVTDKANSNTVTVYVEKGVVKAMSYQTSAHYVNWTQAGGWSDVDEAAATTGGEGTGTGSSGQTTDDSET